MRLIAILLLMAANALACGPFFDDAHHGQEESLLFYLEPYCWRLLHPQDDYQARARDFYAAVKEAEEAEKQGHRTAAEIAWRRALQLDLGFGYEVWIDKVGERVALADLALPDVESARFIRALDEPWRAAEGKSLPVLVGQVPRDDPQSVAGGRALPTLAGLAALMTGEGPAARFAALARIARLMEAARTEEAASQLAPLAASSPEAAYFQVCLPVAATLASHKVHVSEPAAVLAHIDEWCRKNPAHPFLSKARGWMAMVLHYEPALPWNGSAGQEAAAQIYASLLLDPTAMRMFRPVVRSLRFSFRILRPKPPAWVLNDARLATIWAYHVVSDRDYFIRRSAISGRSEEPMAQAAAILCQQPTSLDPALALSMAHACQVAGDVPNGLALVRRAVTAGPQAFAIGCRLACDAGDAIEAGIWLDRLLAADPTHPLLRDLHLRLGALRERAGDLVGALRLYCRGNSILDVEICADGEIPVEALAKLVAGNEDLHALAADCGSVWMTPRPMGFDWRPELRVILGIRLARLGRWAEARPLLDDKRVVLLDRVVELEAAVAAKPNDAVARLALALFWYEDGKGLVFRSRHWQQWAFGIWSPSQRWQQFRKEGGSETEAAQWKLRIAEMEGMTTYHRAYPLFMSVVADFPTDDRAAVALWHAAHCRWWLCDQTYLGACNYWKPLAEEQHYWAEGGALMRRIAQEYPQHPLAKEPKVLRSLPP